MVFIISTSDTGGVFVFSLDYFGEQLEQKIRYNFYDGNLSYNIMDDMGKDRYKELAELEKRLIYNKMDLSEIKSTKQVIKDILSKETSLSPDESRIIPVYASARRAIDYVLKKVALGGDVAIPLPNWSFWSHLSGFEEGDYGLEVFTALSPEQMVENFEKLVKRKDIKALILVNPSNPLGYKYGIDSLKEIDRIAEKHGVTLVIDELLRGNQEKGERESIAAYLSRPYIVEGFSHRFGEIPLGDFSYVLVPEGEKRFRPSRRVSLHGEMLDFAYNHSSGKIEKMLEERNKAFDEGMTSILEDIQIKRPSKHSITSIVYLPEHLKISAEELDEYLEPRGIEIIPTSLMVPQTSDSIKELNKVFRIAIGSMSAEQVKEGAKLLANYIKDIN